MVISNTKVGIGLPVYNGERFIEEAITSILAQTFEDWRLLISDNASTDATEDICRSFADKDDRIQYVRNRENFGYVFNFNNAFRLSGGEYFKWAAYDDVLAPGFLSRCVETLDSDRSIVLAYGGTGGIDEDGNPTQLGWELRDSDTRASVSADEPVVRFRKLIRNIWWADGPFAGVMRSDVLAQTPLHGNYPGGDQVLLAELSLRGRLHEFQEELFFLRVHPARGSKMSSARDRAEYSEPGRASRRGPFDWWKPIRAYPRRVFGYLSAIARSPLSAREKTLCYGEVAAAGLRWIRRPGRGGY